MNSKICELTDALFKEKIKIKRFMPLPSLKKEGRTLERFFKFPADLEKEERILSVIKRAYFENEADVMGKLLFNAKTVKGKPVVQMLCSLICSEGILEGETLNIIKRLGLTNFSESEALLFFIRREYLKNAAGVLRQKNMNPELKKEALLNIVRNICSLKEPIYYIKNACAYYDALLKTRDIKKYTKESLLRCIREISKICAKYSADEKAFVDSLNSKDDTDVYEALYMQKKFEILGKIKKRYRPHFNEKAFVRTALCMAPALFAAGVYMLLTSHAAFLSLPFIFLFSFASVYEFIKEKIGYPLKTPPLFEASCDICLKKLYLPENAHINNSGIKRLCGVAELYGVKRVYTAPAFSNSETIPFNVLFCENRESFFAYAEFFKGEGIVFDNVPSVFYEQLKKKEYFKIVERSINSILYKKGKKQPIFLYICQILNLFGFAAGGVLVAMSFYFSFTDALILQLYVVILPQAAAWLFFKREFYELLRKKGRSVKKEDIFYLFKRAFLKPLKQTRLLGKYTALFFSALSKGKVKPAYVNYAFFAAAVFAFILSKGSKRALIILWSIIFTAF